MVWGVTIAETRDSSAELRNPRDLPTRKRRREKHPEAGNKSKKKRPANPQLSGTAGKLPKQLSIPEVPKLRKLTHPRNPPRWGHLRKLLKTSGSAYDAGAVTMGPIPSQTPRGEIPSENYVKLRKTAKNCAKLRKTAQNCAILRNTAQNCAKLRKTAQNWDRDGKQLRTTGATENRRHSPRTT